LRAIRIHFADQRTPFRTQAAVIISVGSRAFAAMIEELHILALERLDLGLDKGVQFPKLVGDFPGQFEAWRLSLALDFVEERLSKSRARSVRMGGCC
jgi:hypothetical protein